VAEYEEDFQCKRKGCEGVPAQPYYPYLSREQFHLARSLMIPKMATQAKIRDSAVRSHADWLGETVGFESVNEFMQKLDLIVAREVGWQHEDSGNQEVPNEPWRTPIRFWRRDALAAIAAIIGDTEIASDMIWAPKKTRNAEGNRVLDDICSGQWWEDMQSTLPARNRNSGTVIPFILSSDKTLFGSFSGNASGWPLYITVGNVPKDKRFLLIKRHVRLIAMLPTITRLST
jgi:Plavaka transposase